MGNDQSRHGGQELPGAVLPPAWRTDVAQDGPHGLKTI